jgi:cysteine desulfurase/selenocysteine lyase
MRTEAVEEMGGTKPCDADALLDYTGLNVEAVRRNFPILDQEINGKKLVYLDNAASTQKPTVVIEAIKSYYENDHANVHRGVHTLSQRATTKFDEARATLRRFLNARTTNEIIFTKGCTEAINLVANSWGRQNLKPGDKVLLSNMEHHANIVPWQIICEATGAQIKVIPISDDGEILLDEYEKMLDVRVKFVSVVHISNALGTINPIKEMAAKAHTIGAKFLADGAQATAHLKVDVQDLGVDFYTVSGHKLYGPTGVGALYGREEILESMPPFQAGGDMIRTVSFERTTYAGLPNKFEPGTPHISGFIGLGVAIDFVQGLGLDVIGEYEDKLTAYALRRLPEVKGFRLVGNAKQRSGIVSFEIDGIHPHDIGTVLDSEGIAIRTGHHCCMPLMERLGVPATARASLSMYNTREEIDHLVTSLGKLPEIFG